MALRLPRTFRLTGNRWVLWPPAIALAVLLFVGGPGYRSSRSLSAAWDLGHLVAFSLWGYLLVTRNPLKDATPARQWGTILAFSFVAGAATEGIQWVSGGDASLDDFLRDACGGVLTLSWFAPSAHILPRWVRRTARGLAATLFLIACLPLAAALSDEAIARVQFPVLSDFETPFETSRWDGGARDTSFAFHGKASLRVDMDTSLYSGIALVHFPRDWKGYGTLNMEVLNPSSEEIDITCRIHDRQHEKGDQRYEDRFNKGFLLRPGWNDLRIDLGEVARAPVGRSMDLREIRVVGIFATGLTAPRTIYVDHVRLQ